MFKLLFEATGLGGLTVLFGNVTSCLLDFFVSSKYTNNRRDTFYEMGIVLFFTGFLIHIFCEIFEINKIYCKHGYACNKNKVIS